MVFNLGKENDCTDCRLEPLSGGEIIEIEYVQFRNVSVSKIADIMKNGVKRENQDLIIDSIICKGSDYDKLPNKRYKATFVGLADVGNNVVMAIEFTLSNIEISFDRQNVKFDSDNNAIINLAEVTVYPLGNNSFRVIQD